MANDDDDDEAVIYDDAAWHYEGDFPEDLPEFQGFVNPGFYLGWLCDRQLISCEFREDFLAIDDFLKRKMSGPKLLQLCDGVLAEEMLNDEGNAFSRVYYGLPDSEEISPYLSDYLELLAGDLPTLYHVEDTWANYDVMAKRISERFEAWKSGPAAG